MRTSEQFGVAPITEGRGQASGRDGKVVGDLRRRWVPYLRQAEVGGRQARQVDRLQRHSVGGANGDQDIRPNLLRRTQDRVGVRERADVELDEVVCRLEIGDDVVAEGGVEDERVVAATARED